MGEDICYVRYLRGGRSVWERDCDQGIWGVQHLGSATSGECEEIFRFLPYLVREDICYERGTSSPLYGSPRQSQSYILRSRLPCCVCGEIQMKISRVGRSTIFILEEAMNDNNNRRRLTIDQG